MTSVCKEHVRRGILLCLLAALLAVPALAAFQTTSSGSPATPASDASKNAKSQPNPPSASDIAAAKAGGKVWVNLDSGVYHQGGRWYGKTKNGKFMTVDDAKKAGYKPAKRD
ncbi:MAG TPA: hypothetical protein VNZ03_07855 [Terriglobales bacterium]|nr:hypothetical protein [Terriglobales bacterium]